MTEDKQLKNLEWLQKYTLTKQQVNQLILNKVVRAQAMQAEMKKREMLCGDR